MKDSSKSLSPYVAVIKGNISLVIPKDPFWFLNNKVQNVDGDQQGKVKHSVLPDFLNAKRHLDSI